MEQHLFVSSFENFLSIDSEGIVVKVKMELKFLSYKHLRQLPRCRLLAL